MLLTSIEDIATRSDLLDRCLIVWLPTIPKERRRPEDEMRRAFENARPRIFGALLDAVSGALRNLESTRLERYPRMADFARWVTAAEPALGWPSGTFMAAYGGNQESANELALEASVVARPLLELLEAQAGWQGSASELLKALEEQVDDQAKRQHGWPKNPRSLSGHLKRLSPNLRAVGWSVEHDRTSRNDCGPSNVRHRHRHPGTARSRCKTMPTRAVHSAMTQVTVVTQTPEHPQAGQIQLAIPGRKESYDAGPTAG